MKKVISTALAGVMAATMFTAVPAFSQNRGDRCMFGNCDRGDRWDRARDRGDRWDRVRDRNGWQFSRNRHWDNNWRWRHRHRDRWDNNWRWRHRYRDRWDSPGLVFGLAAGAIAGSIAGSTYGGYGGSYERCAAAFRSFDPATWTYLGYDGYRHRCPY